MLKEKTQGFSLKSFTAAVIGIGGLGCNIAVHLAGAGIGELILCDFDKVSESNLNRQFLYTANDIGKEKVFASEEKLKNFSPNIDISAYNLKAEKNCIPEEFRECDIIFLAVDNKEAREVLSDFSKENDIPLMLGGIDGFYGKTYLYIPHKTPCPECAGMLEGKKAETNISAAAGIIGSFQAAVGIQYLLTNDISLGGKLTVYDKDAFSELYIKPKKQCRICKNLHKKEETR